MHFCLWWQYATSILRHGWERISINRWGKGHWWITRHQNCVQQSLTAEIKGVNNLLHQTYPWQLTEVTTETNWFTGIDSLPNSHSLSCLTPECSGRHSLHWDGTTAQADVGCAQLLPCSWALTCFKSHINTKAIADPFKLCSLTSPSLLSLFILPTLHYT